MKRYGYMCGNAGRRKFFCGWFDNKFQRDLHAWADKANGFRVRKFETKIIYYGA